MKITVKSILRNKPLLFIMAGLTAVVLVIAFLFSFLLGGNHALDKLTLKQITPTQAAEAMRQDDFYGNYRENILSVTGSVKSIYENGSTEMVTFNADSQYQVICQFKNTTNVKVGQTIAALTVGEQAERLSHAVQLDDCIIR